MDSAELHTFLLFMRKQRADSLRELRLTLREVIERRVCDDTYNSDDVTSILNDAQLNAEATFTSEGMRHAHMTALLVAQYVKQAGDGGVALKGDMRVIEDRERLREAAALEERLFAGGGGGEFVVGEVEVGEQESGEAIGLKARIAELEKALQDLKMSSLASISRTKDAIDDESLQKIKAMSMRIKSLESDLEGRIDKSVPVQNLKKMLLQKNDLLKEYRMKLEKLDPTFTDS
ncbi:Leucine zipper transcription factor-like protein 1 [Podochytrium sp. JEL0797]|nr:Leucine zipper transcription factor-like protein 1 [Podochytrium sp. JEL0797]